MMEKKLNQLFDYHRFARNSRLEAMITDVENRYENALSDDDLDLVCAAGEPTPAFPAEDEK